MCLRLPSTLSGRHALLEGMAALLRRSLLFLLLAPLRPTPRSDLLRFVLNQILTSLHRTNCSLVQSPLSLLDRELVTPLQDVRQARTKKPGTGGSKGKW